MSALNVISDHSKEKLKKVPKNVLEMTNLKMLFLEGNFLTFLPEDIFWKLPWLQWLDLRNNILESVPKSVAFHEHLENLLLTNNNLERLPNELGVVPKLKTLQVSDNPLKYPARNIISEGTKAIKRYLKKRYEKLALRLSAPEKSITEILEDDDTEEEEKVLKIVEDCASDEEIRRSSAKTKSDKIKESSKKIIAEKLVKKISDPYILQPTLKVKKLQHPNIIQNKSDESVKIVHKISRAGSKLYLKSYSNKINGLSSTEKSTEKSLKEGWLNQLRILLMDQQRIIQQERNLKALSDWRTKKRLETPKTFYDDAQNAKSEPPYGTDPAYSKIPSREELASQLNAFFKEKSITRSAEVRQGGVNFEQITNELMHQLKEIQNSFSDPRTPRSELAQAENQIKTIMNIQKKLIRMKASNDVSI